MRFSNEEDNDLREGQGRAGQMWPSDDTEGQTLPEALTGVTPLGKIPFVLMSKRYVNWFLSSMRSSAHLHVLLEKFGSGRERQCF